MSREDTSHTSVLLPTASITLFTEDKNTKEVFEGLSKDWRFARVELTVREGSVGKANSYYEEYESPDLVIVQTSEIDDEFIGGLEQLAGNCSEGTSAIIIGPTNDVNLYRRLIGMGVSDYLVKPVKAEQFSNDIAATLLEKKGASNSRLIAYLGAKGGVGTTSLAEALAWAVSEKLGQKTFLLDGAGGWSTLSVGMDFDPATTIAESSRAAAEGNEDALKRMLHMSSEKLSLLASGGDIMLEDNIDIGNYEELINFLMIKFPIVMVDLSAAPIALKQMILKRANQTLLVTTPTLPSVRAARTLLQEIKQLRGDDIGDVDIILNMLNLAPKREVSKTQIEDGLEKKLSAVVPFDPDLFVKTESEALKLFDSKVGLDIVNTLLPVLSQHIKMAHPDGAGQADKGKSSDVLSGFIAKLTAKS
jgi:pilus assembly protein CpaE